MSQTKAQLVEGNATQEVTASKAVVGAGSAGAPSLTPNGDLNTGVFFPAADTIAFAEGGSEAMRIDSSSRLLLGPSSGQGDYTLQIEGDAASAAAAGCIYLRRGLNTAAIGGNIGADLGKIQFGANDGTVAARIQCLSDATWSSTSDTPGALTFSTTADGASSPTERMRIDSSSRVGIGTSSAQQLLHLSSTGFPTIRVTDADNSTYFDITNSDGDIILKADEGNTFASSAIRFMIDSSEKFRCDSSGRLGIGSSAPRATIEVVSGSTNTAGENVYAAYVVGGTVAASEGLLTIQSNDSVAANKGGSLALGGRAVSSNTAGANWAIINGYKENATSANYAGYLSFVTRSGGGTFSEAARIDSSGRFGIGTTLGTTPSSVLTVSPSGTDGRNISLFTSGSIGNEAGIFFNSTQGSGNLAEITAQYKGVNSGDLVFKTALSEKARLTASGQLLVGTSTARSITYINAGFQIESTDYSKASQTLTNNSASDANCELILGKAGSSVIGSTAVVTNGHTLGQIHFAGADGSAMLKSASISALVDGTPGANDMPGRLVFSTTADGASSPTERMRITEKGEFQTGNTQGSNNILRQVARDAGNSSETFTSVNMGMSDNNTALINISIGGTGVDHDFGGCLLYWYMPRGAASVIHQTIVTAFKGSGIATFSVAVSSNSLVVTKDSDVGVFVTVIGGGGTSIF